MIDPNYYLCAIVGAAIGSQANIVGGHCMRMVRRWQYERITKAKLANIGVSVAAYVDAAPPMPQDRDEAVLYVLRRASEPMGPRAIADAIGQPWASSQMTRICKRLGATWHEGGRYTSPLPFASTQPGDL